jgi:hypothetical protein
MTGPENIGEAKAIYEKPSRARQGGDPKLMWNQREASLHQNRSRGMRMLTANEVRESPERYQEPVEEMTTSYKKHMSYLFNITIS